MPTGISADARNQARSNGARTYQGQACREGHPGMRYTSNGACVICVKERERLAYDKDIAAQRKRDYRARQKATASTVVDLGAELLESL